MAGAGAEAEAEVEYDQQSIDQFHHSATDAAGCSCPIHRNRDMPPSTAPLGLPFCERVSVAEIGREQAAEVYDSHHAYMDSLPTVNLLHHALRYQQNTVGAITYRYPLLSKKRLHLDAEGRPVPPPLSERS
jgi:hypothetical protein